MKKTVAISIVLIVFLTGMSQRLWALTFEFNKERPGVQAFALKNLRFTVDGEGIIPKLPPTFYVITYFPDDIPVLAFKMGKKGDTPEKGHAFTPYLEKLSGGKGAKSINGPHGEKILYNPDRSPDKKMLSSYALWDGWVFIGNKKETLHNLLKLYKTPTDVASVSNLKPSFKEWKEGSIKFWGDNSNNHLNNIFEAQKKTILIPLVKDPKKIQYMAGAFTLTDSREMRGKIIVKPVNQQALKDIEGDAKFISETIRRRLAAIKTPYNGKIYSQDSSVVYDVFIGDYGAAQGQIVKVK
ncbi:MAG: hypothetical protein HZA12_07280 [Nitrospirae bacterium]|nr:hypothetical protein [Nitrospirota bacterium]